MSAPRENRLAHETSPYLLQHKHNPVDWFPWGEEALALAKSEDKPIFLSIGYAACHWCHVMERESFEDEEVAAALREGFVAIKVDREERPDLDALYMTATVAMTGGGGWPMSVFMAPDGRPFFAGTYFPKTGKQGRPGFLQLLQRIRELWQKDRDGLLSQADQLVSAVRAEAAGETPRSIGAELEEKAAAQLMRGYDAEWGGFGPAPKFPSPLAVSLLLRAHATRGDEAALSAALTTLDRMARGGMRDHVGGGFARYSTDARWHVPHFEKMLYDNGQLARVYVEAFQHTGDGRWAAVARETLDYVVRELTGEHGGYLSATDADSEGVEGKYFVWSKADIDALLGDDAAAFGAAFDVSEKGNWEGHNVLWQPRPLDEVAAELGLERAALDALIARSTPKLYEARAKRVPPLCDDKVLTSWNGLMIGAMAFAGRVLDEPRYVASATRAAEMLARELTGEDGRILRAYRAGKAHIDGFLEDYAFLADALIDLYEASGDFAHLERARSLAERAARDFAGGADEGFYTTSTSHEALVVRMRDSTDNAAPSANAILARALGRLGAHLGRDDLRARAERAVAAHGRAIARAPRAFLASLDAARWATSPAIEVAIVGSDAEARRAFTAAVSTRWLAQLVLASSDGASPSPHPLLEGKPAEAGALAFVCRNFTCAAPVRSAEELARALDAARSDAASRPADRAPGRATAEGTARILAAIDPADTTELAGVRAHRAGVMVSCFHEDEVGALVGKALSEGRNLIATDEERANALGDAVDAAIRRGRSRDELVLIGLLGDADVARAQSMLAALRLSTLDVVLVPVEPADRERAVATALAVREAGLAGAVGLYAASLDDLVALGPLPEALRVVAAPLNLLEGAPEHAATLAARGLEVVALRPLEIKVDGRVAQLADAALLPPATGVAPLVSALSDLARLEDQYRATIAVHLKVDSEEAIDPAELLSWSRELKRADGVLDDLLEVEAFIAQTLAPALGAAWGALGGLPGEIGERVEALRERYLEALDKALKSLGHSVARRQAGFAKTFSDALGGWGVADLPMRATRGVLGVSGVRATLIGTRKADQLFDLGAPRDEDKDVITRVRAARK